MNDFLPGRSSYIKKLTFSAFCVFVKNVTSNSFYKQYYIIVNENEFFCVKFFPITYTLLYCIALHRIVCSFRWKMILIQFGIRLLHDKLWNMLQYTFWMHSFSFPQFHKITLQEITTKYIFLNAVLDGLRFSPPPPY